MDPTTRSMRRAAARFGAAVALLLLASCNLPTEPALVFRQLQPFAWTGPPVCDRGVGVARTAADWESIGFVFDQPPAIDFSLEMVAVITAGPRPTTGYSVEIQAVRRRLWSPVVEAVELTLGRCVGATVMTCPRAVLVVPRSNQSVEVDWVAVRPRPGCE